MSGRQLACYLTDVVSRGGRLLLNVGPTAQGEIPEIQQASLRGLGRWMSELRSVIEVARPVSREVAQPVNDPWVRWLQTPDDLVAVVDRAGETTLTFEDRAVSGDGARLIGASGSVRGLQRQLHRDGGRADRRSRGRAVTQEVTSRARTQEPKSSGRSSAQVPDLGHRSPLLSLGRAGKPFLAGVGQLPPALRRRVGRDAGLIGSMVGPDVLVVAEQGVAVQEDRVVADVGPPRACPRPPARRERAAPGTARGTPAGAGCSWRSAARQPPSRAGTTWRPRSSSICGARRPAAGWFTSFLPDGSGCDRVAQASSHPGRDRRNSGAVAVVHSSGYCLDGAHRAPRARAGAVPVGSVRCSASGKR